MVDYTEQMIILSEINVCVRTGYFFFEQLLGSFKAQTFMVIIYYWSIILLFIFKSLT